MGMFQVEVRVSNLAHPSKAFTHEFWVDSGALYTFIPEEDLTRIGVEPTDTRQVVLADGRTDRRLFGVCNLAIKGFKGPIPCPVIFAPKKSLYLLGATALENFGVDVDPSHKRLVPTLSVIGGFRSSQSPRLPPRTGGV